MKPAGLSRVLIIMAARYGPRTRPSPPTPPARPFLALDAQGQTVLYHRTPAQPIRSPGERLLHKCVKWLAEPAYGFVMLAAAAKGYQCVDMNLARRQVIVARPIVTRALFPLCHGRPALNPPHT